MKVMSLSGVSFSSEELLPVTCTSKPQITCTSTNKNFTKNTGYSNQEIYDASISVKKFITTPFKSERKQNHTINYLS